MNRFLIYWLPLVGWISGILVVSSLPGGTIPAGPDISLEYPLHITAFFVLFLLFYRLLDLRNKDTSVKSMLLICLVLTMLVAGLKECLQLAAPTRTFSLKDIMVDGAAATLAMGLASIRSAVLLAPTGKLIGKILIEEDEVGL